MGIYTYTYICIVYRERETERKRNIHIAALGPGASCALTDKLLESIIRENKVPQSLVVWESEGSRV